jgi:hypothetical protein
VTDGPYSGSGGGYGGGGGGGAGTGYLLPIGCGGTNGGPGLNDTTGCGLGGDSFYLDDTLPPAAGKGGLFLGGIGNGGNSGLVILSYTPPDGVCRLNQASY